MAPEHLDDLETLLHPGAEEAKLENLRCALAVIEGPDRGARLEFDAMRPSRVLIGQSAACDLRLTDRLVSRRHAALGIDGHGLNLVDLDSTNGTFVEGLRVRDAHLRGEETIRVGETLLFVEPFVAADPITLPPALRFGRMIGASPQMRRLYPLCERLATTTLPIVIEGETGTGKEVLAESLHEASPRAGGPFVVFDCTATAPSLVESALFGHERGAFTGALEQRKGVFEQAHGGTLFIDELGELDLSLQPKLLRAVERHEVQRVGSNRWLPVDVRVIAATRRDLDREVQAGRFRDDLFFRLALGRIELPPLRNRQGDVVVLARHLWRTLGNGERPIPEALLARFARHDWPGNVRELANAVARALALGELAPEEAHGLRAPASAVTGQAPAMSDAGTDTVERVLGLELSLPRARALLVEEFERRYVERVLSRYDGNVVRAAAASGIARRYFQLLRARQRK